MEEDTGALALLFCVTDERSAGPGISRACLSNHRLGDSLEERLTVVGTKAEGNAPSLAIVGVISY